MIDTLRTNSTARQPVSRLNAINTQAHPFTGAGSTTKESQSVAQSRLTLKVICRCIAVFSVLFVVLLLLLPLVHPPSQRHLQDAASIPKCTLSLPFNEMVAANTALSCNHDYSLCVCV